LTSLLKPGGVFVDVKSAYDPLAIANAGYVLWRL
jgi:UDP-N-acetyl-D-galactosamine dehydrogenase